MIPNIFISSTIQDLSYLRDAIRDLIFEIGYNPIMSEHGEIGYLPSTSAEDSCYLAVNDCSMGIVIVGKRYGSLTENGLSVTHNEFRTIKNKKKPVIFLVSEEVLAFKRVFDLNGTGMEINFPGMENPTGVFQLIQEFTESEINNGLLQFSNIQSAKTNLKKQLAHIFEDLIKKHYDPVKGEIKDILSEITTLRHLLLKKEQDIARTFTSAFRFLLNDENEYLKEVTETISGSLEQAVTELLESSSFKNYLENKSIEISDVDQEYYSKKYKNGSLENIFQEGIDSICHSVLPYETAKKRATIGGSPTYNVLPEDPTKPSVYFAYGKRKFWGNVNAFNLFEAMFSALKQNVPKV